MLNVYLEDIDTPEEKNRFERLYRLYEQDMFRAAYKILKNTFDSEDAVHMAFANIIEHMDKLTDENSRQTRAYLIITVKHTALKVLEMRNNIIFFEDEFTEREDGLDTEEYVISNMEAERLTSLMERLPSEHYEILFLEINMEMSISEIAEQLDITYEAAKKRLQRAKKKFAEIVKEEEDNKGKIIIML